MMARRASEPGLLRRGNASGGGSLPFPLFFFLFPSLTKRPRHTETRTGSGRRSETAPRLPFFFFSPLPVMMDVEEDRQSGRDCFPRHSAPARTTTIPPTRQTSFSSFSPIRDAPPRTPRRRRTPFSGRPLSFPLPPPPFSHSGGASVGDC